MGCDFPIPAWRSDVRTSTGKRSLTFNPKHAVDSSTGKLEIPCGQCMGCRLEKSREWGVRIMHEAQMHDYNCFLTLTYDPEFLPPSGSLDKKHLQDFNHRLRKYAAREHGRKFKFFACGEYGENGTIRPHYHSCVLGFDFPDRSFFKNGPSGDPIFTSETLTDLWGMGHCTVAQVSFRSARYVAGYVRKKITGERAKEHYYRVGVDGQRHEVLPEFALMSRRPGIGAGWADKFRGDFAQMGATIINGESVPKPNGDGRVVVDGHLMPVPRFYRQRLEPAYQEYLTRKGRKAATAHKDDRTDARRYVKREVRNARLGLAKRGEL